MKKIKYVLVILSIIFSVMYTSPIYADENSIIIKPDVINVSDGKMEISGNIGCDSKLDLVLKIYDSEENLVDTSETSTDSYGNYEFEYNLGVKYETVTYKLEILLKDAEQNLKCLFNDDFSNYSSSNYVAVGASKLTSAEGNATPSILIDHPNNGSSRLTKYYEFLGNVLLTSVDVKLKSYADTSVLAQITDKNGTVPVITLRVSSNKVFVLESYDDVIKTESSYTYNRIQTNVGIYETEKWYNIKFYVNTLTGKIKFYLDDVLVSETSYNNKLIGDVKRVFNSQSASLSVYCLDNLKIFEDLTKETPEFEPFEKQITVYGHNEIKNALQQIELADESSIGNIIEKYNVMFQLDFTDIEDLTSVTKLIAGKSYKNTEALQNGFYTNALICGVNNAASVDELLLCFDKWNSYANIEFPENYESNKTAIMGLILNAGDVKIADEIKNMLEMSGVYIALSNSTRSNIQSNVEKYIEVLEKLGLTDDYFLCSNKSKACTVIFDQLESGDDFVICMNNIIEALNSSVENIKKSSQQNSSNSPSSRSSSGSGKKAAYTMPSENINTTANKENIEKNNSVKTASFSDVGSDHWAYQAIKSLTEKNIVSGNEDGTFTPDANIKKEEFVKIVVETFNVNSSLELFNYDDVKKTDWFYDYIRKATGAKLANGVSEKAFGIGENISRQDAAVIIDRAVRAYGTAFENKTVCDYADLNLVAPYASEAVGFVTANNIMSGIGDNKFSPEDTITRAMASKIIYNIILGNFCSGNTI